MPKFQADGSYVLNPLTGDQNYTAFSSGYNYTAYNVTYTYSTVSNTIALRSIDGGASASAMDTRGFIPANRILNTISYYVSDYFAFGSLFVEDYVSDGHTLISTVLPVSKNTSFYLLFYFL